MVNWRKALMAGIAAISFGAAEAAYILDTGSPPALTDLLSLFNSAPNFQYLGVTFNVAAASSITSVEGWIGSSSSGDVLFELHEGATPTGTLLFSSMVAITGTADAWRGATGLDWDVAAGDYTLAVIAQTGYQGWMATAPPSPAGTEWFNHMLTAGWNTTSFNMGWRVGAESAGVPEPGTLALLGLGLAGLGAMRRKKLAA